jgi:hypothetical protein
MSIDNEGSALSPGQSIGPLQPRPTHEMVHIYVQDIGHEEDAYYKLGWRCISRHDRFALLCKEIYDPWAVGDDDQLKFLLMEMTA